MHLELVETNCTDGLRLHGGLLEPEPGAAREIDDVDAVLLIHGTGANFYGSTLLKIVARRIQQSGTAALLANTRGHDNVSISGIRDAESGLFRARTLGAAFETVDECRLDVAAWLAHLGERGYRRIGLLGHSLGAIKCLYSQALEPTEAVGWVAAISPPRLSYSYFAASPRAPGFQADVQRAEKCLAEGLPQTLLEVRFPVPYWVSAEGFLDKYGPAERYNLLRWLGQLRPPALICYGGAELQQGIAFRDLPEAINELALPNVRVATIAGGDHQYTGVQTDLLARLETWRRKVAAAGATG